MQRLEAFALNISRYLVRFAVRPFLSALVEEEVVKQLVEKKDAAKQEEKTKLEREFVSLSREEILEVFKSKLAHDFIELQHEVSLMKEQVSIIKEYSVSQQKELLHIKEENNKLKLYITEKLQYTGKQVQYLYNVFKGKSSIKGFEATAPTKKLTPGETVVEEIDWSKKK